MVVAYFFNYIDVSIVNAWKLWRVVHPTESMLLLKFRREVSVNYLRASKSGHVLISTGPLSRFSIAASRPSGLTAQHFLQKLPDQKRFRCRQCHKQARFQCSTCKMSLHQHCTKLKNGGRGTKPTYIFMVIIPLLVIELKATPNGNPNDDFYWRQKSSSLNLVQIIPPVGLLYFTSKSI